MFTRLRDWAFCHQTALHMRSRTFGLHHLSVYNVVVCTCSCTHMSPSATLCCARTVAILLGPTSDRHPCLSLLRYHPDRDSEHGPRASSDEKSSANRFDIRAQCAGSRLRVVSSLFPPYTRLRLSSPPLTEGRLEENERTGETSYGAEPLDV